MEFPFTKKQVNVLYKAWKQEKIQTTKEAFNKMYRIANWEFDMSEFKNEGHYEYLVNCVENAVQAICGPCPSGAQKWVDQFVLNMTEEGYEKCKEERLKEMEERIRKPKASGCIRYPRIPRYPRSA